MAKFEYGPNPTSVVMRVKLMNSSVTTGAGLTGLAYNTSGLIISTIKIGEATATAYTVAAGNIETISTLGTYAAPTASKCRFKEVDAANHPGIYEIQLADARFASTDSLIISISGATNLAQCDVEVDCRDHITTPVQAVIETNNLDHLCKTATGSADMTNEVADNTIISRMLANGDTSAFDPTTDGLQLIRDAITAANPSSHSATTNTETTGTLDAGTFANTAMADGSYYQTSPAAVAVGGFGLNVSLTFNIGTGRVPAECIVTGYFDSGALRTVQVWGYDYTLADWVQLSNSTNDFGNAGANQTFEYPMTMTMVKSDGEVKIRFTSTSTTVGDDFFCDYVMVSSVAAAAGGLTADAIQQAVWARSSLTSAHDEDTLGYVLSNFWLVQGHIVSVTSASQFVLDGDYTVDDAYNGMLIVVEDETTGFYEVRRIIDYTGATKEVLLDRAVSFTPEAGDGFYILGTGYADVNTTHVEGSDATDQINAACDTALIDYDGPTKTEMDALQTHGDSAWATADVSGLALTGEAAAAVATLNDITVADIIAGIADGSYDLQKMIRIIFAVIAGKVSGGGTATLSFRDSADSKNRVVATVDADGNRTAVTLNGD